MIRKVQKIYPSTLVPAEQIAEYGWKFVEQLPTHTGEYGQLTTTPEVSEYLSDLRKFTDHKDTVRLATPDSIVEMTDFAVSFHATEDGRPGLGFYALRPTENPSESL